MVWYEGRGGGTDNPMIWVHAGGNTHPMGLHVTQAVWDYVQQNGFRTVAYNRKIMQPQLDAIQGIVDALPKQPRLAGDPLQVGDLVKVGAGKVPWTVTSVSKLHDMVRLSSTNSAIGRSELASNLTRLPLAAAAPSSADGVTVAVAGASRSIPGGAAGLAIGAAVVGATVAAAYVVRQVIDRRRALHAAGMSARGDIEGDRLVGENGPVDRS